MASCNFNCQQVSLCLFAVTSTTVVLNLFLPSTQLVLVRSTNPYLLQQPANVGILYDNRLTKINVVGPGFIQYTDINVLPGNQYYYRLINVCGNEWESCIVTAFTPLGPSLSSFVVNSACTSASGVINLTVSFGTIAVPLYNPLYYTLRVGTSTSLI